MKKIMLLLLLFVAGCATVSVNRFYKDVVYPPTKPESVAILPEKPSGRTFHELGEITVNNASTWNQVEKIFEKKAAEMGADAVYVFNKQLAEKQYVTPGDCYGYYYPYAHFGWEHYHSNYFYPRGYYYCYGYQSTVETEDFISAVGIAIKFI